MDSGLRHLVWVAATIALGYESCARGSGPLSPDAAIADIQVPAGLRVELVAAEPLVIDPVAIAFDEQGRLWVVEMRDYPLLPPEKTPTARIRVLRDRDRDGQYETATTFAEGLLFPTGVQPWRGGVIATLAGEVAYFPDDNQDDVADGQEIWYRGFAAENEQLRANHPTFAADGRVFVAGGLRGGSIESVRNPKSQAVSINGRDFAFDPVSGRCEAVTGNGQFGMTFDDVGRRFTCSNRNPLVQVMIEQRYLKRNPKLVLPAVVQDVAAAGDASRLFPRTRAETTANSHAGQFTAACGVEIYRGNALSSEFHGNAFISEPTANLVHCEMLDTSGVAFRSQALAPQSEFLTSSDEWFRPVNLATGPDGALYVVDMCRAVIEHPEWMPEELRSRAHLRLGNDRGRIYRIVADEAGEPEPGIVEGSPHELLALLEHPNAWQRENAARLIRERGATNPIELRRMATQGKLAATRIQALWLLEGLRQGDDATLLQALSDVSPSVREQVLILAERRFVHSVPLLQRVLELANDPDPRVRFQVALSLSMSPEAIVTPLVDIALRDAADQWTCRAVAVASRSQATAVLAGVLHHANSNPDERARFHGLMGELAVAVVATSDTPQIVDMLGLANDLDSSLIRELMLMLAGALEARDRSLDESLAQLEQANPAAHAAIERLFERATFEAGDERLDLPQRVAAVQLLRHSRQSDATTALLELIQHHSPVIQVAAIEALAGHANSQVVDSVLTQFSDQMPSVRRASLDLLTANRESSLALLRAVEAERIAVADIDVARAQRLKEHSDETICELARRVLGARSSNREEVVRQYRTALALSPDRANGRKVFAANCSACHRLGGAGTAIGPDIGDSALRTPEQVLADILQPNLAVDANYVSYTAITHDGRVHQGVIRTESDSGIALVTAEGKTVTISRDDLESLHSSGASLMPEGVEQQISPQQMADLIGYLRNWREAVDE